MCERPPFTVEDFKKTWHWHQDQAQHAYLEAVAKWKLQRHPPNITSPLDPHTSRPTYCN
jgi:hypothetical protein